MVCDNGDQLVISSFYLLAVLPLSTMHLIIIVIHTRPRLLSVALLCSDIK